MLNKVSSGFLVYVLAAFLLAGASAIAVRASAPAGAILRTVEAVTDPAASPPTDGWREQTLPHDWDASLPLALRDVVWYRAPLPQSPTPEAWAVMLPKVSMHASVFVGNDWVGGTETGRAHIGGVARRPWLFVLPPASLRGQQYLHIRVAGLPNVRSGIGNVWVGPLSQMRPAYERQSFIDVTVVEWLNVAVLALAALAAAIWWQRRKEAALGWFAAGATAWVLASHHAVGGNLPLAEPLAGGVAALAMGAAGLFTLRFAWAFSGNAFRWAPALTWGYLAIGVLAIASFLALSAPMVVAIWLAPLLATPVVFTLVFAYAAGSHRNRLFWGLAMAGALGTLASVHDTLLYAGGLGFYSTPLLPYASAALALAVAAALAHRFVRNTAEVESLNRTLEARVEEKHAQLEASYAHTRSLEAAQTLADERARLTRDMHDGLGGQLMSALALVDAGKLGPADVAGVLRDCIDDMRLIIDSLEPEDTDLVSLLGNLRYRLAPRLAAAGLTLKWELSERVGPATLSPENRLNVLRIVQEALTNVLKHAAAKTVVIKSDEWGNLSLADDGRGVDPQADPAMGGGGHGSRNMDRRAAKAGARLVREPRDGGGTVVRLVW
jgi:signal transduction histidine kinase